VPGLQEAQDEPDQDEQPAPAAAGLFGPLPEQAPQPQPFFSSAVHSGDGRGGVVSGGEPAACAAPAACASPAMGVLAARLRTSGAFQRRLLALLSTKGGYAEGPGARPVFSFVI
jgi:hypothetical protein